MGQIIDQNAQSKGKLALVLSGLAFLIWLVVQSVETVQAGHVKVATLFGKVANTYSEGFHIVNPLYAFHPYDVRQKTYKFQNLPVPSQDQLITNFDVSVQFHVTRDMAEQILMETGSTERLVEVHMVPKFRSLMREVSKGVSNAELFYQEDVQKQIQTMLLSGLKEYCASKGLSIQEILIRNVQLPQVISEAVEKKKRRQQQAEEQKAELERFSVEQEQKLAQAAAERRAAEEKAQQVRLMADAEAYRIEKINAAVRKNPAYIQLQAIDAMVAISKNPASQIYFLNGESPNPLPLMHMGKQDSMK